MTKKPGLVSAVQIFLLFGFSIGLRLIFFQGFILGDDAIDVPFIDSIVKGGTHHFQGLFEYRIFSWLFNVLTCRALGFSEWSFFLPTWIFSASLGVIGYGILRQNEDCRPWAFLGGLFVASAPFEVLMGTVRSNDLFLEVLLAAAFLILTRPSAYQRSQGIAVAVLLWMGFYVKLWAIYFLPVILLYYAFDPRSRADRRAAAWFIGTSLAIHGMTFVFWKFQAGTYFPFLKWIAPSYPWARNELGLPLKAYPGMVFLGSEFHTTLFGVVPYLYMGLAILKAVMNKISKGSYKFDSLDRWLFLYSGSLILLFEFFPNNFKFDHYYSVARIFRYLAPLSFPLALHPIKLLIDLLKKKPALLIGVTAFLVILNVVQSSEATRPGRQYRAALLKTLREVHALAPPRLVVDSWLNYFMGYFYTRQLSSITEVTTIQNVYDAKDYEKWIHQNESQWEPGTVLLTGLGEYVHYGCHFCGTRLRYFSAPLGPRWEMFKVMGPLDYLPNPEPAALWILKPNSSEGRQAPG